MLKFSYVNDLETMSRYDIDLEYSHAFINFIRGGIKKFVHLCHKYLMA